MSHIPNNYYKKRIEKLRKLLTEKECDALLIFNAENEDPSLLSWALGSRIFDSTYLLVKKTESFLFIPQWRLADAYKSFSKVPVKIIGTGEKTTMIPFILPYLKNIKSLGFAGNAPYKEMLLLKNIHLKNVENTIRNIYQVKDAIELELMKKSVRFTKQFMRKFPWKKYIGKKEIEISKMVEDAMWNQRLPISHLCITAGPRTKKTTSGFPSEYRLKKNDPICLDFGVIMNTYYSDITFCYFLGSSKKKYEKYYRSLKAAIFATADRLQAGTPVRAILRILKEEYANQDIEKFFVPTDLGHGIGTGLHEYPEIGYDDRTLEKGNVFTLEPEAKLPDGTLLRYEDIFYIDKTGKCKVLIP